MGIRELDVKEITEKVAQLCISANNDLGDDVLNALKKAKEREESPVGKEVLDQLLENAKIATAEQLPICQDTGVAIVFLELGQEVHLVGGDLNTAIAEGVKKGYTEGYLRKSMIKDPITNPKNTGDNTPPIIYTKIVPGDKVKIVLAPKGGGSENCSRVNMSTPAAGLEGVKKFVIETVEKAGPNPCPPIIVGVGIGGDFEYSAYLSKKAVLREIGEHNPDPEIAKIEDELLEKINKLGIGPAGLGGTTTALAVNIEVFPRHIASFPVAVNIQCHAARHKSVEF